MVLKPVADSVNRAVEETYRVLYVEDDDTNWEVALLGLRHRCSLTRAFDSRDVFAKLREQTYDAVLVDIELAGSEFDGISITKILRQNYDKDIPEAARGLDCRKVPIIFVTAYNARYRRSDLLAIGGDDVIVKPVDFTRLSLAISRLVTRGAR